MLGQVSGTLWTRHFLVKPEGKDNGSLRGEPGLEDGFDSRLKVNQTRNVSLPFGRKSQGIRDAP